MASILENKVAVITGKWIVLDGHSFCGRRSIGCHCGPQRRGVPSRVCECREHGGTTIFHSTDVAAESDKGPHYRRVRNVMKSRRCEAHPNFRFHRGVLRVSNAHESSII